MRNLVSVTCKDPAKQWCIEDKFKTTRPYSFHIVNSTSYPKCVYSTAQRLLLLGLTGFYSHQINSSSSLHSRSIFFLNANILLYKHSIRVIDIVNIFPL